jgi:uncharacterized protein (TIGR02996 family)
MPSDTQQSLLNAIVAHPDDDAVRMVYADWLDENGDPDRGEFIRAQCRLAQMNEWDEGYTELAVRSWQLLRANKARWLEPLADIQWLDEPWWRDEWQTFGRGFPERLDLTPEQFIEQSPRLFEAIPLLGVGLIWPWDVPQAPETFWSRADLHRLRQLWVYFRPGNSPPPYPDRVLLSPQFRFEDLGVPSDLVHDLPGTLASAPFAPNLRRLDVVARGNTRPQWHWLWGTTCLQSLRRFGFRTRLTLRNELSLEELTGAPWFPGLERLELAGTWGAPLVTSDVSALLRAGRLQALALEGCGFSEAAVAGFRTLPPTALEHLDLGSGRRIDRRMLRAILHSPGLTGLRSFALSGNGNAVLAYLLDSPLREALRSLQLSGCSPTGLLRLSRVGCPQLARLTAHLHVKQEERALLAQVVDALLDPQAFPRLVRLKVVGHGDWGGEVIRHLAAHQGCARLKDLGLRLDIGQREAKALADSPWLGGLGRLSISLNYSTPQEEREEIRSILFQRFGSRLD